jgi:hypothetical protein
MGFQREFWFMGVFWLVISWMILDGDHRERERERERERGSERGKLVFVF